MFDSLLKSKFFSKCRADIKLTKARIEIIKRKRNAMAKYLRNDIVDLLKNGLDYNAYGRAEGLLVELNLSSCYDILDQACACILTHLSAMNKQRECPEECKEAVPTLMFAAARFADLPELRAIRSLFVEKYGNSLEPYVNHELVMKSKSTPPTKDMKLQLLQDVASAHGVDWDSKALEQKLYKPPPSPHNEDNNNELHKRSNPNVWRTVDIEVEDKRKNLRDDIVIERYEEHDHPRGRKIVPDDDKNSPLTNKAPENIPSDLTGLEKNEGSPEDTSQFNYSSTPPPYTKPKVYKDETTLKAFPTSSPYEEKTTVSMSIRRRRINLSENKQEGDDEKDGEEMLMDKLLMHYSKKPSPKEPELLEDLKQKRKDGVRTRTNSLPGEASTSTAEEERKGHARASSFRHEKEILGSSDHSHPKPLDYDDFIARFAALRGKEYE